jgi:hypothetical protein
MISDTVKRGGIVVQSKASDEGAISNAHIIA